MKIPKQYIHYISVGLLLLFYIFCFIFLRSYFMDPASLMKSLEALYATYGYGLVLLAGLIEGTFLLGMYIPGTAIILFGAIFARTGALSLLPVILLGATGLVIGYTIDYFLGKYGWHEVVSSAGLLKNVSQARHKLEQYEKRALFLGFCSPFFATFLSTAAGVIGLPFKRFILLVVPIQLFWTTVYATIAYIFGMVIVEFFMRYMGLVVTGVIILWLVKNKYKKN